MKLETLYTLDSKNKIRVFEAEIITIGITEIVTRTGLLGGKLIEKSELVAKGKQNRTIQQQAEFQLKSLWENKLDEGYKSFKILKEKAGSVGIITQENEIDIKLLLVTNPNASYTNKNWDELPMLAYKFKDVKKPQFPYIAQPKLNGVRCLVKYKASQTGFIGPINLCSRGGQYYTIPHLQVELEKLYHKLNNDNIILDGEIYKHGVSLQEISGAARKEESGMFTSNNWLEYHIYDIISNNINYQLQKDRRSRLYAIKAIVESNEIPFLKIVDSTIVTDKNNIDILHNKYISQGYEGLILRNLEGKYEFNQRSNNLLKVKEYIDSEFKIISCSIDPNNIGDSFVFILQNDINSSMFEARPTGTREQKLNWYNNPDSWNGKKATVRYFERSKDGIPLQGSVQHKISKILIEHLRPNGE